MPFMWFFTTLHVLKKEHENTTLIILQSNCVYLLTFVPKSLEYFINFVQGIVYVNGR